MLAVALYSGPSCCGMPTVSVVRSGGQPSRLACRRRAARALRRAARAVDAADDGQYRRRAGPAVLGSARVSGITLRKADVMPHHAHRGRRHRPRGHARGRHDSRGGRPAGRVGAAAGRRAAPSSHGTPLPAELLDSIGRTKVALKGPVTTPVGGGFTSVNVGLRKALDLFANLRPVWNIPVGAVALRGRRPRHRAREHRGPLRGARARGRAGRRREPEDHHREGVDAHRDGSRSSTRGRTAASG